MSKEDYGIVKNWYDLINHVLYSSQEYDFSFVHHGNIYSLYKKHNKDDRVVSYMSVSIQDESDCRDIAISVENEPILHMEDSKDGFVEAYHLENHYVLKILGDDFENGDTYSYPLYEWIPGVGPALNALSLSDFMDFILDNQFSFTKKELGTILKTIHGRPYQFQKLFDFDYELMNLIHYVLTDNNDLFFNSSFMRDSYTFLKGYKNEEDKLESFLSVTLYDIEERNLFLGVSDNLLKIKMSKLGEDDLNYHSMTIIYDIRSLLENHTFMDYDFYVNNPSFEFESNESLKGFCQRNHISEIMNNRKVEEKMIRHRSYIFDDSSLEKEHCLYKDVFACFDPFELSFMMQELRKTSFEHNKSDSEKNPTKKKTKI